MCMLHTIVQHITTLSLTVAHAPTHTQPAGEHTCTFKRASICVWTFDHFNIFIVCHPVIHRWSGRAFHTYYFQTKIWYLFISLKINQASIYTHTYIHIRRCMHNGAVSKRLTGKKLQTTADRRVVCGLHFIVTTIDIQLPAHTPRTPHIQFTVFTM